MRAFLCSIDDAVWDAVKAGWTRTKAAKSTWDKAALAAANANSKALNAIFCGVSQDEWFPKMNGGQQDFTHYGGQRSMGDIGNHLRRNEENERH